MGIVGRVLLIVAGCVVGVGVIVAILFLAAPTVVAPLKQAIGQGPAPRWVPAARVTVAANPGAGVAGQADAGWIASVAKKTGIPPRALEAYAGVAIVNPQVQPSCGIGWNLLAAIGEVESRHGTIFGGKITSNGDAVPSFYGVTLDGGSTAHIPDSDGGAIDGDPTGDRAVGPMQLIPEAWRNWHVDGNGDGVENPQNIDDATMAAAHYLCRAGGNLSTESGWRTAVLAYNSSDAYVDEVARYAASYGAAAK
ncbi:MAG: lytic murein transglycosylase [Actinomycetota bacterium]